MKKFLLLIPTLILPYCLLFALYCIFTGFLMESVFKNNAFIFLIYLGVLFLIALICSIVFIVLSFSSNCKAGNPALMVMILKLTQIPAYIAIFILGFIFFATIFTFAFTIFFVLFDCLIIFLSGIAAIPGAIKCYREKKCSGTFLAATIILQFVFCVDIVFAVILCVKASNPQKKEILNKSA